MASIKATINNGIGRADTSAILVTWAAVTESDTFAPVALYPDYTSRSVHVSGTFGGSTVVLKGSNTGTNFIGCKNPQGVAISKTSEDIDQVQEAMAQYQPVASGGTAQSLTVTMLFVRASQPRG